jgi:hypothetical protein
MSTRPNAIPAWCGHQGFLAVRRDERCRVSFGSPAVAGIRSCLCPAIMGQGVSLLKRFESRFLVTIRQRSYSVLILSSLSRVAVMDSSIELFPLIHVPPSLSSDWRISAVTVPQSKTSVTTVASSPSGLRMYPQR